MIILICVFSLLVLFSVLCLLAGLNYTYFYYGKVVHQFLGDMNKTLMVMVNIQPTMRLLPSLNIEKQGKSSPHFQRVLTIKGALVEVTFGFICVKEHLPMVIPDHYFKFQA